MGPFWTALDRFEHFSGAGDFGALVVDFIRLDLTMNVNGGGGFGALSLQRAAIDRRGGGFLLLFLEEYRGSGSGSESGRDEGREWKGEMK